MPRFREGGNMGFISTNDLSASTNIGLVVKLDSSKQIVLATAGTDKIIGALLDTPAASGTGTVRLRSAAGTISLQAGGNIAVGDAVTATTGGQVIATTTSGDQIVGYAIDTAAANGLFEAIPAVAKY